MKSSRHQVKMYTCVIQFIKAKTRSERRKKWPANKSNPKPSRPFAHFVVVHVFQVLCSIPYVNCTFSTLCLESWCLHTLFQTHSLSILHCDLTNRKTQQKKSCIIFFGFFFLFSFEIVLVCRVRIFWPKPAHSQAQKYIAVWIQKYSPLEQLIFSVALQYIIFPSITVGVYAFNVWFCVFVTYIWIFLSHGTLGSLARFRLVIPTNQWIHTIWNAPNTVFRLGILWMCGVQCGKTRAMHGKWKTIQFKHRTHHGLCRVRHIQKAIRTLKNVVTKDGWASSISQCMICWSEFKFKRKDIPTMHLVFSSDLVALVVAIQADTIKNNRLSLSGAVILVFPVFFRFALDDLFTKTV